MPNIVFTKGANTFTFSKGRVYPLDDPRQVNVPTGMSEGGQLYAYNKGVVEQFINLVFERILQADFVNVDNWLVNRAVGPLNTFTYTDEDGVANTVRLLDTKNPLREVATGLFSGTIRLRKEI
jgi:hypothetical protein